MSTDRFRSRSDVTLEVAQGYRKHCKCGSKQWTHSTNGDGSTLQICSKCGVPYPIGRYYQDLSVGVRYIALSMLSATFTSKPKPV